MTHPKATLVGWLRMAPEWIEDWMHEASSGARSVLTNLVTRAADRLEVLEAQNAELKAALASAEAFIADSGLAETEPGQQIYEALRKARGEV